MKLKKFKFLKVYESFILNEDLYAHEVPYEAPKDVKKDGKTISWEDLQMMMDTSGKMEEVAQQLRSILGIGDKMILRNGYYEIDVEGCKIFFNNENIKFETGNLAQKELVSSLLEFFINTPINGLYSHAFDENMGDQGPLNRDLNSRQIVRFIETIAECLKNLKVDKKISSDYIIENLKKNADNSISIVSNGGIHTVTLKKVIGSQVKFIITNNLIIVLPNLSSQIKDKNLNDLQGSAFVRKFRSNFINSLTQVIREDMISGFIFGLFTKTDSNKAATPSPMETENMIVKYILELK